MNEINEFCILNTKDMAELFGVTPDYITRVFCRIPGFPFTKVGKMYFFDKSLVQKWMVQNQGNTFQVS